jgi:hypothetical protein
MKRVFIVLGLSLLGLIIYGYQFNAHADSSNPFITLYGVTDTKYAKSSQGFKLKEITLADGSVIRDVTQKKIKKLNLTKVCNPYDLNEKMGKMKENNTTNLDPIRVYCSDIEN